MDFSTEGIHVIFLCLEAYVVFSLWQSRKKIASTLSWIVAIVAKTFTLPLDARVESRLGTLRPRINEEVILIARLIVVLVSVVHIISFECGFVSQTISNFLNVGPTGWFEGSTCIDSASVLAAPCILQDGRQKHLYVDLIFCFAWYLLLTWLSSHASAASAWRTNLFWATFVVVASIRLLIAPSYKLPYYRWTQLGLQALFIVQKIDPLSSLVGNCVLSCVSILRHMQDSEFDSRALTLYPIAEAVGLFTCTWFSILMKHVLVEVLSRECLLEDSQRAMHSLLSGFCDAKASLDSSFRIVQSTPQLGHLLCPRVDHRSLEGKLFDDYLATHEKERFTKFMTSDHASEDSAAEGTARMLLFTLRHTSGSVELFHVHFQGGNGSHHLIGLREGREGNDPVDETVIANGIPHGQLCQNVQAYVGASLEEKRQRSCTSHVSKSSDNSSLSSVAFRDMPEVQGIRFKLEFACYTPSPTKSLCITEYTLSFREQAPAVRFPQFASCLVSSCRQPVSLWLSNGLDRLIKDPFAKIAYEDGILFRHPNAACATSNIILHAKSATLEIFIEDEDDAESNEFFQLELHSISQARWRRSCSKRDAWLSHVSASSAAGIH